MARVYLDYVQYRDVEGNLIGIGRGVSPDDSRDFELGGYVKDKPGFIFRYLASDSPGILREGFMSGVREICDSMPNIEMLKLSIEELIFDSEKEMGFVGRFYSDDYD